MDSELNTINARINELKQIESGFAKYSRYGISLLSNLSHYYEIANLEVKQKMIGLIFPEKLEFVEGEYRTKEANEILMLLCSSGKGFRGWRKEKAS